MRAMCGAISPTKLNGPIVSVALAVKAAASSSSASREAVSAMPAERAVALPKGSSVSQRLASGANDTSTTAQPALCSARVALTL